MCQSPPVVHPATNETDRREQPPIRRLLVVRLPSLLLRVLADLHLYRRCPVQRLEERNERLNPVETPSARRLQKPLSSPAEALDQVLAGDAPSDGRALANGLSWRVDRSGTGDRMRRRRVVTHGEAA